MDHFNVALGHTNKGHARIDNALTPFTRALSNLDIY